MSMPKAQSRAEPVRQTPHGGTRRGVLLNLAVNVAAPLAVFYGLRAVGVGQWLALTLGVVPPAIRAAQTILTRRRIDGLGAFTFSVLVLTVATSFLTGSPRFLLARDGWLTGLAGLWILATIRARRPFYFHAFRAVATGRLHSRLESAWGESADLRHTLRVASLIWGVGLVADSVLRVVLAYSLPVDVVPLISGLQYVVAFAAIELGSQLHVRRAIRNGDLKRLLGLDDEHPA